MAKEKARSVAVTCLMVISTIAVACLSMSEEASAYTIHDPIEIVGDADFAATAAAEGWPGAGTESEPYTIDFLEITGNYTDSAISVMNTTVDFVIVDCAFSSGDRPALYFMNVSNARVSHCVFTCPYFSIYFDLSEEMTISDNTILGGSCCMGLVDCESGLVDGNTVTDSEIYPLLIASCEGITLRGNSFHGSGIEIWGSFPSEWNTHEIDDSNTVDGLPLYYFKDQDGVAVPSNAGQVILANCTNTTVRCDGLSETGAGVSIGFGFHNTVTGNEFSSMDAGISVWFSPNCTLELNQIRDCTYGIEVRNSPDITIENTMLSGCMCSMWIQMADRATVLNNCVYDTEWYGVFLDHTSHADVRSNIISAGQSDGVQVFCSNSNLITLNTFEGNLGHGVAIYSDGAGSRVFNNSFVHNHGSSDTYSIGIIQGADLNGDNFWDSNGTGNYWADWTGPDDDGNGIVDLPYEIAGGEETFDRFPLVSPPSNDPDMANVTVSLEMEMAMYRLDMDVRFTVEVANEGDATVEVEFPNGQWVDFNVTDPYGIEVFDWSPDVVMWLTALTIGPGELYSLDLVWPQSLDTWSSSGTYTINAFLVGYAGPSLTASADVIVDGEAPETACSVEGAEGDDGWYVSPVNVTLDATDEWAGVYSTEYRVDSSEWDDYAAPFEVSGDGRHDVMWFSTDLVGNCELLGTVDVGIDSRSPMVEFDSGGAGTFYGDSFDVAVTCSDDVSGVDLTEYSLDAGEFITFEGEVIALSGVEPGDHVLLVRAVDAAGNEVTETLDIVALSDDVGTGIWDDIAGNLLPIAMAVVLVLAVLAIMVLRGRMQPKPPA